MSEMSEFWRKQLSGVDLSGLPDAPPAQLIVPKPERSGTRSLVVMTMLAQVMHHLKMNPNSIDSAVLLCTLQQEGQFRAVFPNVYSKDELGRLAYAADYFAQLISGTEGGDVRG